MELVLDMPLGVRDYLDEALTALRDARLQKAASAIEAVAGQLPGSPLASHLVGLLSLRLGEPGKAIDAFDLAHRLAPEHREPVEVLGIVHARLGRVVDSLYFRKLTIAATRQFGPDGLVPDWLGDFETAFFRMEERPLLTEAETLLAAGNDQRAGKIFRQAIEIDPQASAAWRGLVTATIRQNRPFDALDASDVLLGLPGSTTQDVVTHGELLAECGQLDRAADFHLLAARTLPDHPAAVFAPVRTLSRRAQPEDAHLATAAQNFAARFSQPSTRPPAPTRAELTRRGLRLGIVSGQWRDGAGLEVLLATIETLDRRIVTLSIYAEKAGTSSLARRLKRRADSWQELDELDDETAIFVIRNDAPDVLLDLDGPIRQTRPALFLDRPAALTLSVGAATCCAETLGFDGVIGGVPDAVVRIAASLAALPADLPRPDILRREPGASVVLGAVAPAGALNAETVSCWSAILRDLPEAELRLDIEALGGPRAANHVMASFAAKTAPGQVSIEAHGPDLTDYLNQLDIVLDPLDNPFPEIAFVAAGLGLPVLTRRSQNPRAALLTDWLDDIGLSEFVASSAIEFAEAATRLSGVAARRDLRVRQRAIMEDEREHGARRRAARLIDALADALLTKYPS